MKSKPRIPPIITPIAESDRNANSIWYRFFDSLLEYIVNGFPDAPDDGNQYGRQSLQWTVINPWVDAPADNLYYGRVNQQWGVVVEEAPIDGVTYVRKNGVWIQSVGSIPAPPQYSVQYNDPLGTFAGTKEFRVILADRDILVGDPDGQEDGLGTYSWTISPPPQGATPNLNDGNAFNLFVEAGKGKSSGDVSSPWGCLHLRTPVPTNTTEGRFTPGAVLIYTGSTAGLTGSWNTSPVSIYTGAAASSSGQVLIRTGQGTGGASGDVQVSTGNAGGSAASGKFSFASGSGQGSGAFEVATGAATTSNSGLVRLATGQSRSATGNIELLTGNGAATYDGSSGNITLTPGTPTGTGTYGNTVVSRLRLPHGSTPSGLIDGLLWTTTAGLFARINGATVGPFAGAGAGTPGGASGTVQYNNAGAFGGITNLTTDGTNVTAATIAGTLTLQGALNATTAKATFAATVAGYASINLPHGTAPSAPTNGDVWTTTVGMYVRINGATVGPIGSGSGSPGGSSTQLQYNNAGAFGGISSATSDGTSIIFGTAAKIKGEFSAATFTDRTSFQSSTLNGFTAMQIIPNGTSRTVAFNLLNASSPTANEPYFGLVFDNTIASIDSLRTGSATAIPIQIRVGNSAAVTAYFATNLNINLGSTPGDPGYKVQVEGTLNVTGVARFASTTTHLGLATFTGAVSGANGQIFLNNGTSNWINWATPGVAAPTFTTRSAGIKLILYPSITGSAVDYGFGIESGTLWSSVSTTAEKFKWYGGTTVAAWMSGTGNLSLGVGAAPSAWGTSLRAVENGRVGNALYGNTGLGQTGICCNYYFDGTNLKYANTGALGIFELLDDALTYSNAASGTGGTNATIATRFTITANGNIVPGNAALATSATDGFLYLPTCAGAPSGTPTAYTGRVAQVYDTTNNRLYVYNGGWKSVVLA